jgi:hypothetical protein
MSWPVLRECSLIVLHASVTLNHNNASELRRVAALHPRIWPGAMTELFQSRTWRLNLKLANISSGNNLAHEPRKSMALSLLMLFLLTLTLPQAQAQKFTLKRLNPPGSTYSFAFGLNNNGKVVGSFVNAKNVYEGFIYDGATY